MNKLLIASDHAGFELKEKLKKYLQKKATLTVVDLGTYSLDRCDYPEYAAALARQISLKKAKRGILICKTGIGNSIVANRFPGVRASLCCNERAAQLTREHNDSNVLVLGSGFVSPKKAEKITDIWLKTEFMGERHAKRLAIIKKIEKEIGCTIR
ncbi:MAG TPA: ribose 5-phosphate isomerase B [Candidatus Omnitrophota bacterium]|nr:ribose 5-phosphate isomerase B [Candidatus Omnitrophota bacterium]HPT06832.1 ribose 5-phosphate isomerase B [Candidatus Omnitrophota bacterium]